MNRRTSPFLLLSCLGALSLALAPSQDYGVGFSLSLDYGTAAVYFENGTVAHVAKIEGSHAYKRLMHSQDWIMPQDPDRYTSHVSHKRYGYSDFLRSFLPPWLGGKALDFQEQALHDMLLALLTATEAYVGPETKVAVSSIGFPAKPPPDLQSALRAATRKLGLRQYRFSSPPAGMMAAAASKRLRARTTERAAGRHGIFSPSLILSIDYSRAALTAVLFSVDDGMLENLQGIHNSSLGADSYSVETKANLKASLEKLIEHPVERLEGIDELILLGENGHDPKLLEALEEVFPNSKASADVGAVFAAAEGMAYWNLHHLNDEKGLTCNQWSCDEGCGGAQKSEQ